MQTEKKVDGRGQEKRSKNRTYAETEERSSKERRMENMRGEERRKKMQRKKRRRTRKEIREGGEECECE